MPEEGPDDSNRKSALAYAAALSFFFSVATLAGIGYLLDRWLGIGPWLLVGGIVVGGALGFYEFIRLTSKIN
jgi:ATP synthase protein I